MKRSGIIGDEQGAIIKESGELKQRELPSKDMQTFRRFDVGNAKIDERQFGL